MGPYFFLSEAERRHVNKYMDNVGTTLFSFIAELDNICVLMEPEEEVISSAQSEDR